MGRSQRGKWEEQTYLDSNGAGPGLGVPPRVSVAPQMGGGCTGRPESSATSGALLPAGWMSRGCHSKVPQTGWHWTTGISSLIVLEAWSLKSRRWQGHAPSEGPRGGTSLFPPASGGSRYPWPVAASLQSLPPSSHGFLLPYLHTVFPRCCFFFLILCSVSFYFILNLFIYLFLAVLGLRCWAWAFL